MRNQIIIALIALSLFLSSCNTEGSDGGPVSNYRPFIGGSEGVTMEFVQGAPPPEISDDGEMPFTVSVIIENVGEYEVPKNEFLARIIGIEPNLFGVSEDEIEIDGLEQDLRGANKLPDGTSVPGDIDNLVFPTGDEPMYYLPNLRGTDEILLQVEMCYLYTTYSTTHVCIQDKVLENMMNDKVCSVNEQKMPQNSGGPIHVSSLRQMPQGRHNTAVTFTIEHVGSGLFFHPAHETCQDRLNNPEEYFVYVDVYFEDPEGAVGYDPPEIQCGSLKNGDNGPVQLYKGNPRDITCTIKGSTAEDDNRIYQDLLHIDLQYRYMNFIQTPIIVRDMNTEDE